MKLPSYTFNSRFILLLLKASHEALVISQSSYYLSFLPPTRYRLSGLIIPSLKDWMENTFGASLQHKAPAAVSPLFVSSLCLQWMGVHTPLSNCNWNHNAVCSQPILNTSAVQPPTLNEAFVEEIKSTGVPFSHDPEDRVFRAHGKAYSCIVTLLAFLLVNNRDYICDYVLCIFFQGTACMRSLLWERGRLGVFQIWWYGQVSWKAVCVIGWL